MRYLGGKARVGGKIAGIINKWRDPNTPYLEPFVGSCGVMRHVRGGQRFGSDANKYLIALWRALQDGWIPPSEVSEERYAEAKAGYNVTDHERAFIGFGCSFGGKWFGGYARGDAERNYASNAHNAVLKILKYCKEVTFLPLEYSEWDPCEMFVYCDPPYANTTGYGAVPAWEPDKFWATMRQWSVSNDVLISEYQAPDDFACVAEFQTKTDMHTKRGKESRVERLFTLNNGKLHARMTKG